MAKSVQAAGLGDEVDAGGEQEMVGVGQDGRGAEGLHFAHGEGFDGGAGGGADEGRGLEVAVRSVDDADAGEAAGFHEVKFQHDGAL